ncbi:hypothetical protein WKH31_20305 [Metabacillus indicus]|uniref:hypothetical protein n=1 Tax=Metabacillus indicus TaxID=246786 RepID=UPI0031789CEA
MPDSFVPKETASSLPMADAKMDPTNGNGVTSYYYQVKQPNEEKNDFLIEVRASKLRNIRRKVSQLADSRFPWHELLLGVSTTSLGAFFSGLLSDISLSSTKGIFVFILCPVIAMGAGVGYLFKRYVDLKLPRIMAKELLDELVDPDKTTEKE